MKNGKTNLNIPFVRWFDRRMTRKTIVNKTVNVERCNTVKVVYKCKLYHLRITVSLFLFVCLFVFFQYQNF